MPSNYDCIILGGGPAGLSAALVLGRSRRRVVVCDAGKPRNGSVRASHGVLTRDGAAPKELRRIGRQELAEYDITFVDEEVVEVVRDEISGRLTATTRSGSAVESARILLATGMRDRVPDVPGFRELFGKSVFVCPYCDGWENRGRRLVAYAPASTGPDFALGLTTWSDRVTLVTPGEAVVPEERRRLERNRVALVEEPIRSLEAQGDALHTVLLRSGEQLASEALFLHFGEEQATPFAAQLGCQLSKNGTVITKDGERAGHPGVFVAGDASHDLQLIVVAMAEGAKAACAINTELRREAER